MNQKYIWSRQRRKKPYTFSNWQQNMSIRINNSNRTKYVEIQTNKKNTEMVNKKKRRQKKKKDQNRDEIFVAVWNKIYFSLISMLVNNCRKYLQ